MAHFSELTNSSEWGPVIYPSFPSSFPGSNP